jgi:hypothetical protein
VQVLAVREGEAAFWRAALERIPAARGRMPRASSPARDSGAPVAPEAESSVLNFEDFHLQTIETSKCVSDHGRG